MKIGANYHMLLATAYTTIFLQIWINYFYVSVHVFNGNEFLLIALFFYGQAHR